jgi:hypothetical protein
LRFFITPERYRHGIDPSLFLRLVRALADQQRLSPSLRGKLRATGIEAGCGLIL